MRSMKFLMAAAAAFAVMGCNAGQPRIYRVAVDESQLKNLPANCYVDNSAPGTTTGSIRESDTNIRSEYEWVVWDGVEGKQYLDVGNSAHWEMGDARSIDASGDLIEGENNVFNWSRTDTQNGDNGYSAVQNLSAVVTFEDLSATAKGTLSLTSKFDCNNCGDLQNTKGFRTCGPLSLNFAGRRVDTQRISVNE